MSDAKWCPPSLRGIVTDYIQFGVMMWRMDIEMASLLRLALERLGVNEVVDLCSGSGGPWFRVQWMMEKEGFPVKVWLTDKYPNAAALTFARNASGGKFDFCSEPVDATRVPETLGGFRTIFSGFHHFRPGEARDILRDAVDCQQGIAIFEITKRTAWSMLNFAATALLVPLCVPLLRPFRWSRLLWTYLFPVATPVILFDSLVSCLRSYSITEMRGMTEGLDAKGYTWEAGEIKPPHSPVPITFLMGYPKQNSLKV